MHKQFVRSGIGAVLFALGTIASAQSGTTFKNVCIGVGGSAAEPIPGLQGQALSIGNYVCTVEGGALDGATLTGQSIWQVSGPNGTFVSGNGIARMPGAQAVYDHVGGKITYLMSGNQVVGFEGEGKAVYRMASGSAASLQGKSVTYKFKATGPGRFVVEGKFD